ncbi:hypothetical protein T10_5616 [Trichinella papuae]|uniref:Uncharacterized protein n=1 Tax=Trichinella papuae TaxID=268474 RepID=A0A0V1MKQ0_9BILA|nr:hypothetical protein T10_5616 [Trichinella papuae]
MKWMYSQQQSADNFSQSTVNQAWKIINQFDQDVASTTNHSWIAMHSHVKRKLHDFTTSNLKAN